MDHRELENYTEIEIEREGEREQLEKQETVCRKIVERRRTIKTTEMKKKRG